MGALFAFVTIRPNCNGGSQIGSLVLICADWSFLGLSVGGPRGVSPLGILLAVACWLFVFFTGSPLFCCDRRDDGPGA